MDNKILQRVKELELDILNYVDQICRKNGIKYYLVGGTLLGAIRHRGFIPWDDDIDIAMFRDDYNRFNKIVTSELNSKYFVQNFNTDYKYTRYITKIRLNNTKFVEKKVSNLDINHGIFIDIFPLDKIDKDKVFAIDFRDNLAKKIIGLHNLKAGIVKGSTKTKTLRNIFIKLLYIIPYSIFGPLIDFIYGCMNKKDVKYITNFSSQYGWRKQTFPIDVYGGGTYLEFEGHQFMAPAKWDVILKSLYGDYMKLPPEEKRNSGHDVVHIDLGKYAEN